MNFRSSHFEGNGRLAEAAANNPPLKKGEAGFAVRLLQQALIDLNYPLPKSREKFGSPDGLYGKETRKQVWQFQVDEHLGHDGIAGEETLGRLDKLLADKRIPFRPFPALPPGSPGDVTDPDLDTQQAILETLALPMLKSINFELHWNSTTSRRTGIISASSARIRGTRYAEIADAVFNGRIAVMVDPAVHENMKYASSGPNADTFRARRAMTLSLEDMAVIVHEATHAVCDFEMLGVTDALFAEAIAFVAECIFFRKAAGRIRPGRTADERDVLARADAIAQKIMAGTTTIDDADPDLVAIDAPLQRTHAASAGKFNHFNGLRN